MLTRLPLAEGFLQPVRANVLLFPARHLHGMLLEPNINLIRSRND
jgi:hypothetical protein